MRAPPPQKCSRALALLKALAESPEGGAIGDLAAAAQVDEALDAEAIQQLELPRLVAELVKLLEEQRLHHDRGREWRASALPGERSRGSAVNLCGQDGEVNMPLHHLQHIAQALQLGFAFLGDKQAVFDHQ